MNRLSFKKNLIRALTHMSHVRSNNLKRSHVVGRGMLHSMLARCWIIEKSKRLVELRNKSNEKFLIDLTAFLRYLLLLAHEKWFKGKRSTRLLTLNVKSVVMRSVLRLEKFSVFILNEFHLIKHKNCKSFTESALKWVKEQI